MAEPSDLSNALPVTEVTCLEDRAQVTRRGVFTVDRGVHTFRLSGVSALAVDRSLKVEVRGAQLVDARLVRAFRARPKGGLEPDASVLRRRAMELERTIEELDAELARRAARLEVVQAA